MKNRKGSWCNLVINLVRFLMTSQLHVSTRITLHLEYDPDLNRMQWCTFSEENLVSNPDRIEGTSQLHASSRILGLPNQDPASKRMESSTFSEENPVSNPGRIEGTSQLHGSSRNSSFPQEKRAVPCRILVRSVTEHERKSHRSPLGLPRCGSVNNESLCNISSLCLLNDFPQDLFVSLY